MGGRAGLRGLLQFDRFGDEELEARFQRAGGPFGRPRRSGGWEGRAARRVLAGMGQTAIRGEHSTFFLVFICLCLRFVLCFFCVAFFEFQVASPPLQAFLSLGA